MDLKKKMIIRTRNFHDSKVFEYFNFYSRERERKREIEEITKNIMEKDREL